MEYAVLAHSGDVGARLVAAKLGERVGTDVVGLVLAEELTLAPCFSHRVGPEGEKTELRLADGRSLHSHELRGVVSRLTDAPAPRFARNPRADRDYAAMEGYALLLSWLASLPCPVVNPASPRGLAGPALGLLEWLALGAAAGLPPRRFRLGHPGAPAPEGSWLGLRAQMASSSSVGLAPLAQARPGEPTLWAEPVEEPLFEALVVGDRVFGAVGHAARGGCVELARRAGCAVLAVHLACGRRGTVLCGADPMPELGPAAATALAQLVLEQVA